MHKRIYIIGNSASGKTSLVKRLSKMLRIKTYDLDDYYWEKKFTKKRDKKQVDKLVRKIASKDKWIIEGVYSSCAKCSIGRAQLVVWLDYSFYVLLLRLIKRQLKKKQEISQVLDFIHYIWDYYKKPAHKHYIRNESNRYKHLAIVKKYCKKAEVVHVKNKKQLERFVKDLEN